MKYKFFTSSGSLIKDVFCEIKIMIGIFDSGVGGMTVARAIEKKLPEYNFAYYGDLARTPYGSKSPETIIEYSRQNTEFLLSKGAKIIIVACNSAASVSFDILRQEYDVPIFEVITPAVKKAIAVSSETDNATIGVIGTRATIKSGIYEKLIKESLPDARIYSEACPLLAPLVEEGWLNKQETKMIIRRYLSPLKQKMVQSLVLGCTHYPLLMELIQPRMGKRVKIIDSSEEVATSLKTFLDNNTAVADSLTKDGRNHYFVSDVTSAAEEIAELIFGRKIVLEKVVHY